MNYAAIKYNDIANGPGVRVSLFVSGCRHACPGCFNREAWDFDYGSLFDDAVIEKITDSAGKAHVSGITLLGGEPFEAENRDGLIRLVKRFRERCSEKTVWCFTGYTLEELLAASDAGETNILELLSGIDTLVDGKFVAELRSASLIFRGSSNQRILDVARSLESGAPVIMDGVWERRMGSGNIYDA